MALTLTLDPQLKHSLGKTVYEFASTVERVALGRSDTCDVQFPDSLTRLGREHFELRKVASGYQVVADLQHPVYLDGERVIEGTTLTPGQSLRLLDAVSGPTIRVDWTKDATGSVTEEAGLIKAETWAQMFRRLRRRIILGAITAALLAAGFAGWLYKERADRLAFEALTAGEFKTAFAAIDAAGKQVDWQNLYAAVRPSVYQVALLPKDAGQPIPHGTAWVIGERHLITNAHVANEAGDLTLVLLAPDGSGTRIPIVSKPVLHPAYLPHIEHVQSLEKKYGGKISRVGSYDVAMLEVPEGTQLGPPLELADASTRENLAVGTEVATVGYPSRNAVDKYQQQFKIGVVTGTSDFLGVSRHKSGELVYHSLAAEGGASGSPIFNGEGKVVAVLSGGERQRLTVAGQDAEGNAKDQTLVVGSAAAIFYGQSASLIEDIKKGLTEEELAKLKQSWSNSVLYKSKNDAVWAAIANATDPESLDEPLVREKATLAPASEARSDEGAVTFTKTLPQGTYVAFAHSQGQKVALYVRSRDADLQTPVYVDQRPVSVFEQSAESDVVFAVLGKRGQEVTLVVECLDGCQ